MFRLRLTCSSLFSAEARWIPWGAISPSFSAAAAISKGVVAGEERAIDPIDPPSAKASDDHGQVAEARDASAAEAEVDCRNLDEAEVDFRIPDEAEAFAPAVVKPKASDRGRFFVHL